MTTASIAANASWDGTLTLRPGYRLLKVVTDHAARLRVYTSADRRTADASREIGVDPTGAHGVILDFVTTPSALEWWLNPAVDGYTEDGTSTVPISVTNLSTGTHEVTVTVTWLKGE